MIERRTQAAMIVVLECHKAERLQHAVRHLPHGAEDFGHTVYRTCLRLKRDLYKVALPQRMRQTQQTTGHGNGLELSFCATAVFETDRSQDRISKLDPGRAPRGVRLGEVGHKASELSHYPLLRNRLLKPLVRIPLWGPDPEALAPCNMKHIAHVY